MLTEFAFPEVFTFWGVQALLPAHAPSGQEIQEPLRILLADVSAQAADGRSAGSLLAIWRFEDLMIIKKTPAEIELLRVVNRHVARLLVELSDMIRPGVTTLALDRHAESYIRGLGAIPTFSEQAGFPNCICTSVNEVVVHGVPSARPLKSGDIVSIDAGMQLEGWCGDACTTVLVGEPTPELERLREVTKQALSIGIDQARLGTRLGAVGHAIQTYVEAQGYGVVRAFCGHGIGESMHEEPEVKHFGAKRSGPVLEAGMVICIEPMVTAGTWRLELMSDGWSARTVDMRPSAQFEHTIAVTREGPLVLSLPD